MIDLVSTALTVVVSAVVGGAIAYIVGVIKIRGRVENIEKWRVYIQEDTDNSLEERSLILSSLFACLKGLQEQGCNGPVTQGIKELDDYLNRKAHVPRSYTKEQSN